MQLQHVTSKRSAALQLLGGVLLGSVSSILADNPTAPVLLASAATSPRQLTGDVKAAVLKALSQVVTKPKAGQRRSHLAAPIAA